MTYVSVVDSSLDKATANIPSAPSFCWEEMTDEELEERISKEHHGGQSWYC